MARKRMVQTFKEARNAGPYDEYPVLTDDVDPQLHLSRNDRQPPLFLTCENETALIQLSGRATVEFRGSSVNTFDAVPGDYVYIPGGTPHRLTPVGVTVQYRHKALKSGLEGVSFRCPACDETLFSEVWDTADELPQKAYLRIVEAFNDDAGKRTCTHCSAVHPVIDLADYRWKQIAEELTAAPAEEAW